jgi:hypothetical protein
MSDVCVRWLDRAPPDAGSEAIRVIALWVAGGAAAIVIVVAIVVALRRDRSDLGAVSSHWISEHRLGSNQDYSRR